MAYPTLTLFFLLLFLPLFSHAQQSCPRYVNYTCPDFHGNSVSFPFTNKSQPNCGLCALDCQHNNSTTIQCGKQGSSYKTKGIFPDNNTIVLVYPGLCNLISNVCSAHQTDSLIVPNAPLTFLKILNLMVFFRCQKGIGAPPILQAGPSKMCGNDTMYGPYTIQENPDFPQQGCSKITLPNSTDDSFTVKYSLPSDCSECASDRTRCFKMNDHEEIHCPNNHKLSISSGTARELVVLAASLVGTLVLISAVLFLMRRQLRDRFTWDNQSFETFLENNGSLAPKRYTYTDVRKMTNSFKEKLGEGGYGGVYKGKLLDGRLVAVKLLKHLKGNGEDFINEVSSISRTNHVNVVTLLGFCCAGRKRALVFEFMENGSLEKFINDGTNCSQSLPLERLFAVVIGIARGLEYLHQGCKTRILHCDIKPHNILLDEEFRPKISDFGLAKVSQQNKQSKVSMSGTRGTIGYISPEMFCRNFGEVSHKSDVYSYGMMVLEMIGSRKKQDPKAGHSSEQIFPQWIYEQLEQGVDVEVGGYTHDLNDEEKTLKRKMIIVSLWCIQTAPSSRPSMSNVLQMLEGSLELIQIPSMPTFCSPPRTQFVPSGSSKS